MWVAVIRAVYLAAIFAIAARLTIANTTPHGVRTVASWNHGDIEVADFGYPFDYSTKSVDGGLPYQFSVAWLAVNFSIALAVVIGIVFCSERVILARRRESESAI